MTARLLAALFVLALWWLSTGVVLRLVWLGRDTFRRSAAGATLLAAAGLYGLWWSAPLASAGAAYLAFASALAVWAWHELTFLFGAVTGPRTRPCPPQAAGWRRFGLATAALLYHELALALTIPILIALTRGGPNRVGLETFLVLWVMRLSAKLNVFLGVRNLAEGFLPAHLRYLLSYARRARLNPLMPASLAAASAAAIHLGALSLAADASPLTAVGGALVTTLLVLAVLEHVFLALPLPDALLWRWALPTPAPSKPLGALRAEAR
ncbi:MAG TPA: putative photosynthetic complex assembly protein PuhE [Polyangiaceae bacterium]|nr:putative photosynthetic complex assembly protein PuhE [Polyangiaceae bacterium]